MIRCATKRTGFCNSSSEILTTLTRLRTPHLLHAQCSIHAHKYIRSCSKSIGSPEHPFPNHHSVRVPRAYGHQSIHSQTIIPFVFRENTVTRASIPKPSFRSCSKSIRSPEHPFPNHHSVRVPRAYGHQSIHSQTIIPFVFRENTVTRASIPKPSFRSCSKSIRSPEHPFPNHHSVRVPRA